MPDFLPVGSYMWAVTVITKIMNIVRNVIMMVIVRMIIKADNTLLDLHNSSDDTKAEFNNCFIHSK